MKIKLEKDNLKLEAEGTEEELKRLIDKVMEPKYALAPFSIPSVWLVPACGYANHEYENDLYGNKCKHCGTYQWVYNPAITYPWPVTSETIPFNTITIANGPNA